MTGLLGESFPAFIAALEERPPTAVRMNPFKGAPPPEGDPIPWATNAWYLSERPRFHLDPLWHAGAYYVQEASSMFIEQFVRIMDLPAQARILDACAAPGGKSTHLQSLAGPESLLVANEVIPKRNLILRDNLVRWGQPGVIVTQSETRAFGGLPEAFDLVVVDAPCSGEGLFRKDPLAIREWSEAHVSSCAVRQAGILADVTPSIKPGGYLLYATCTFSLEENEAQVARLLDSGQWESVTIDHAENFGATLVPGGYRFYPHRCKGEGFFAACLRRKGASEESRYQAGKDSGPVPFSKWMNTGGLVFEEHRDQWTAFPAAHSDLLDAIRRSMRVTHAGTTAGQLIRGELKPAHDLALSNRLLNSVPSIELPLEEAQSYLKKQTLLFNAAYAPGWHVVTHASVPLGWVKVLDNRINNYYPKALSLRP